MESQGRFAKLFEQVASDPKNYRPDFKLPKGAVEAGVEAFTKEFNRGQVWVYVRDFLIINAGVNRPGWYR